MSIPALPSDDQLESWLRTAREAAEAAAAVHRDWAGRVGTDDADLKGVSDWVSHVDLTAQQAALAVIHRHHPDHLVLAEEGDASEVSLPPDATPIWIVDPLDGTTNFLHGHPMYAASVAVAVSGQVMAGAVTAAALDCRWWARRGGGAFGTGRGVPGHAERSGDGGSVGEESVGGDRSREASAAGAADRRVAVSPDRGFASALVATGFPFKSQELLERFTGQLARVLRAGAGVRRDGAAAVDLCFVADGRFSAFWELSLSPWDYAAGALIVEEAGGVTGRVAPEPLGLEPGSVAAGCSPEMLERLRELVEGSSAEPARR